MQSSKFYFLFTCTFLMVVFSNCQQTVSKNDAAPDGFQIHPQFKMELVANEPLVFDPVDMDFDENGDAYVLEMPGYPLSDEDSRLVYLRDNDADGMYDERIVYADDLGVASSAMPYKKGFLIAAPPHLIYLKDYDGDKVADEREIIMSGFETGNLQHNFNGLTYGLDNWIYAANGGNNGQPYFVDSAYEALNLRGNDFRIQLKNNQLEQVGKSSGGFEIAFDQWGNMFQTHNTQHVSQLVIEGKYTNDLAFEPSHALTLISDHDENGLARIYPIGEQETRVNHPEQSGYFSGACGITFYGGDAFPKGFNNNLFVADVVLNLIHMDVLSPQQAAYKTSRHQEKAEFIASKDRSFRPVNLTPGPDGALYVLDIHRAVIEHPEWIPDEIEKDMDLAAGKDKGRIYKITPRKNWKPYDFELNPKDETSLIKALGHDNQWVRMTAQRLIVESENKKMVPLLNQAFNNSENELEQIHLLWTMQSFSDLDLNYILNELVFALSHKSTGLKINALKIITHYLNQHPTLIENIIPLSTDPSPQVRMQTALALSTIHEEHYKKRQAIIEEALSQILDHPDTDQWTAMAVASAAKKDANQFALQLLSKNKKLNEAHKSVIKALAQSVGQKHNVQQMNELLSAFAKRVRPINTFNESEKDIAPKGIEALAEGWKKNNNRANVKAVLATLETVEKNNDHSIIKACGNLRNAMQLPVSASAKQQIKAALIEVKNKKLPIAERMKLLQLAELENFEQRASTLYHLLDNREALALQKEALEQLRKTDEPSVGIELVKLWPSLGPEARKQASNILLYKVYNQPVLLTALEEGKINMGEMNFDLERRRTLLWWTSDEEVKKRAEALFSDAGVVTRKEAIEKMRPALALKGNLENGVELFTMLCSQCHVYGSQGKNVGPVLTEINRKSKESLLYDILDPNAAVDTKFINHQVRTKDGNIYTGIIANETDNQVTLKNIGGQEQTINKSEIEQLSSMGISMMPEGQEENMTAQQMADLLAFLQQENI